MVGLRVGGQRSISLLSINLPRKLFTRQLLTGALVSCLHASTATIRAMCKYSSESTSSSARNKDAAVFLYGIIGQNYTFEPASAIGVRPRASISLVDGEQKRAVHKYIILLSFPRDQASAA